MYFKSVQFYDCRMISYNVNGQKYCGRGQNMAGVNSQREREKRKKKGHKSFSLTFISFVQVEEFLDFATNKMSLNHLIKTNINVATTTQFSKEGQVAQQLVKTQFTTQRQKQQFIFNVQFSSFDGEKQSGGILPCSSSIAAPPCTRVPVAKPKSVPQWHTFFCTRGTANTQDTSSRVSSNDTT